MRKIKTENKECRDRLGEKKLFSRRTDRLAQWNRVNKVNATTISQEELGVLLQSFSACGSFFFDLETSSAANAKIYVTQIGIKLLGSDDPKHSLNSKFDFSHFVYLLLIKS